MSIDIKKLTEYDIHHLFDRLIAKTADDLEMENAAHLIHHYFYAIKGPQNFETWHDAAVYERVRRVKAEERSKRLDKMVDDLQSKLAKAIEPDIQDKSKGKE